MNQHDDDGDVYKGLGPRQMNKKRAMKKDLMRKMKQPRIPGCDEMSNWVFKCKVRSTNSTEQQVVRLVEHATTREQPMSSWA